MCSLVYGWKDEKATISKGRVHSEVLVNKRGGLEVRGNDGVGNPVLFFEIKCF